MVDWDDAISDQELQQSLHEIDEHLHEAMGGIHWLIPNAWVKNYETASELVGIFRKLNHVYNQFNELRVHVQNGPTPPSTDF